MPQPIETVLCIHANCATGGQWRPLAARLGPGWRVLSPDCHGSGGQPDCPRDRPFRLADELRLLGGALRDAGGRFHLVGHSYGGAIALMAALAAPQRVASIVLYEPSLFWLARQQDPKDVGVGEIRDTVMRTDLKLQHDDRPGAAREFIDYWAGAGAFDAMPPPRQQAMTSMVVNVRCWWDALSEEATPLSAFAALQMPVLYLVGDRTTAAARSVARVLQPAFPDVEVRVLAGLGHMGPLTHPDQVGADIAGFICRQASSSGA
jgi:pimeloyl-ACP methyl ester carboxylesterase